MKRSILLVSIICMPVIFIAQTIATDQDSCIAQDYRKKEKPHHQKPKPEEQNTDQEDDQHTSEILASFAQVVTNFGKVLLKPKDAENVESGICNMIAGTLSMIAHAMRNGVSITKEEAADIINHLDNDMKTKITEIFDQSVSV